VGLRVNQIAYGYVFEKDKRKELTIFWADYWFAKGIKTV